MWTESEVARRTLHGRDRARLRALRAALGRALDVERVDAAGEALMLRLLCVGVVATLLAASGCASDRTRRYRVSTSGDGASDARRCADACTAASRARSDYAKCLSSCPGVEVEEGTRCGPGDTPPRSACVEITDHSGPSVTPYVVAGGVVVVLVGVFVISTRGRGGATGGLAPVDGAAR
jgi:hypothetical protein